MPTRIASSGHLQRESSASDGVEVGEVELNKRLARMLGRGLIGVMVTVCAALFMMMPTRYSILTVQEEPVRKMPVASLDCLATSRVALCVRDNESGMMGLCVGGLPA